MTNSNKTPLKLNQRVFQRSQSASNHLQIYLLLGLFLVGYAILTLNGYGNHDDIYRMIGTWRSLITEHRYVPSRFQGYLIPELVIGLSSQIGGFYLSNLVSALLSIASLFIFYRLLVQITTPLVAVLAVAAVGSNPFWIIPSVTSTDYVYPAFFFLLGLLLLLHEKTRLAAPIFALAVSSRITYAPMVVMAFGFYFLYIQAKPDLQKRFFQAALLFILSATALYLPVFFASGMTLSFLGFASETSGGAFGIFARFLYKNVYLWGLPAFLVLAVFFFRERNFYWNQLCSNPLRYKQLSKLLFHAVFWCWLYNELLFFRLPHQYQYLIPVLFCVVYWIATLPSIKKKATCLSLILILHLVYGFLNLDVLDTYQTQGVNQTIHSDGAKFQLSLGDGVLVRDFKWRSIYQRHLVEDFNKQWQAYGSPLANPR